MTFNEKLNEVSRITTLICFPQTQMMHETKQVNVASRFTCKSLGDVLLLPLPRLVVFVSGPLVILRQPALPSLLRQIRLPWDALLIWGVIELDLPSPPACCSTTSSPLQLCKTKQTCYELSQIKCYKAIQNVDEFVFHQNRFRDV